MDFFVVVVIVKEIFSATTFSRDPFHQSEALPSKFSPDHDLSNAIFTFLGTTWLLLSSNDNFDMMDHVFNKHKNKWYPYGSQHMGTIKMVFGCHGAGSEDDDEGPSLCVTSIGSYITLWNRNFVSPSLQHLVAPVEEKN